MTPEASATGRWPDPVSEHILSTCGAPSVVEPLGGMSGGTVARLRFADRSLILKGSASGVERHVYTRLGARLGEAGVELPALVWSAEADGRHWLLLEDIPQPLPRERWLADPELLAMLRRLHALALDDGELPAGRYQPRWPAVMTEQALTLFPARQVGALQSLLDRLRAACEPLFAPRCPIAGDPNPANWGLRADGTLVLFDWERLTRGTPALDLAITVPGLGSRADFTRVATVYLAGAGDADALARAIGAAKVWSVVEFLALVAEGVATPPFPLGQLLEAVPSWLAGMHPDSGTGWE